MKCSAGGMVRRSGLSPPSRGAWIEIYVDILKRESIVVAPLAGGVD